MKSPYAGLDPTQILDARVGSLCYARRRLRAAYAGHSASAPCTTRRADRAALYKTLLEGRGARVEVHHAPPFAVRFSTLRVQCFRSHCFVFRHNREQASLPQQSSGLQCIIQPELGATPPAAPAAAPSVPSEDDQEWSAEMCVKSVTCAGKSVTYAIPAQEAEGRLLAPRAAFRHGAAHAAQHGRQRVGMRYPHAVDRSIIGDIPARFRLAKIRCAPRKRRCAEPASPNGRTCALQSAT